MLFYMDTRYEGGDETGTPDLSIPNIAPTGSTAPQMGKLCTLVAWHKVTPWMRLNSAATIVFMNCRKTATHL